MGEAWWLWWWCWQVRHGFAQYMVMHGDGGRHQGVRVICGDGDGREAGIILILMVGGQGVSVMVSWWQAERS